MPSTSFSPSRNCWAGRRTGESHGETHGETTIECQSKHHQSILAPKKDLFRWSVGWMCLNQHFGMLLVCGHMWIHIAQSTHVITISHMCADLSIFLGLEFVVLVNAYTYLRERICRSGIDGQPSIASSCFIPVVVSKIFHQHQLALSPRCHTKDSSGTKLWEGLWNDDTLETVLRSHELMVVGSKGSRYHTTPKIKQET